MKGYFRKRNDKWAFTIDVGKPGARKQKSKSGFKTKKEAQKACAELIIQIENGQYQELSEQKLEDFLKEWHNNYSKQVLGEKTHETQGFLLDKHIIPTLGRIKMKDLKFQHVRDFYNGMLAEDYSPRTVKRIHDVLRAALNKAMEWEMLHKNVASLVKPPRIPDSVKPTWSIKEANQFLQTVKEERFSLIYFIAVYTGMRLGEILGLRWRDIDFEGEKFYLKQGVTVANGKLKIGELKTRKSKRPISIPEFVFDELKKHRVRQLKEKMKLGEAYNDMDLVNCSFEGKPLWPANVRKHYYKWIEIAEVPKITLHDLRHTHATIMLQIGEHPKIVAERLGHSRVNVLLDTYSHVLPDIQKSSSDNFAKAMQRGIK
jgi:integrase